VLLRVLGIALAGVALVLPASAADRIFLTFPGASFAGNSTDPFHPSWIEVYALSGGVAHPAGGNASFGDVNILKGTDPAMHKLLELNQTSTLAQAVIEICPDGATSSCYLRMTLDDVLVTSSTVADRACLDPSSCTPSMTQSVSLSYARITWAYSTYDSKGTKVGTNSGCWDLSKAASCGFTDGIP
jgi:type VI secretion system Hcp family effector